MTFAQFHNALRILRSIDAHELGDPDWWPQFREDPYGFLILTREGDEGGAIWRAMVKRGADDAKRGADTDAMRQWIADLIRNEYDKAPDLGCASYPAFEKEWDDGAERIADQILERFAPDKAITIREETR